MQHADDKCSRRRMTTGNKCLQRAQLSAAAVPQEGAVVQHPLVSDHHRQAALGASGLVKAVKHPEEDQQTLWEANQLAGEAELLMPVVEACSQRVAVVADHRSLP